MKKLILLLAVVLTTYMLKAQVPTYVPTNGLLAYYPFNGNANDVSGNGYNGTIVGTVPFISDRNGNINSAIQGGSGYIPTSNQFFRFSRTDSFTISVWFTVQTDPCTGRLLSTESPEGHLRIVNGGSGQIVVQFGEYLSPSPVTTNQWHHLIYVYDNRNEMVYIDGQLSVTNYELEMSELLVYNTPFTIGAKAASAYDKWCGNIDDVGVWNRALTQAEITQLYYAENTCQSLVINTGILSFNPPTYYNTVTIYPNPANDRITIDCGNLANVSGWTVKISNELGQEVFSGVMNTQQYVVPLNTWTGKGIYFVKIVNAQSEVVNTKKIILQ